MHAGSIHPVPIFVNKFLMTQLLPRGRRLVVCDVPALPPIIRAARRSLISAARVARGAAVCSEVFQHLGVAEAYKAVTSEGFAAACEVRKVMGLTAYRQDCAIVQR